MRPNDTPEIPAGKHRCAAIRCTRLVPTNLLMCMKHWLMVPKHLATAVWREYHSGLRHRNHPTPEYWAAVEAAQNAVAGREGATIVSPKTEVAC